MSLTVNTNKIFKLESADASYSCAVHHDSADITIYRDDSSIHFFNSAELDLYIQFLVAISDELKAKEEG